MPANSSVSNSSKPWAQWAMISIAVGYLALVLLLPAVNVFYQAFAKGFGPFLGHFAEADMQSAIGLTLLIALIVVPLNTVFGLFAAWAIARHPFRGKAIVISILDLPFSISPVVAGLMMVLLYGQQGWLSPILQFINFKVIFAVPGIVLATTFVTLPFVAREVIPVLEEIGTDEEEAARTLGANNWQIFWNVTLPNIRWGLLYGVLLTNARAMGEFGAVSVVAGNIARKTQTLSLFVEDAYKQYATGAAFSASVLLGALGLLTLVLKEILERKTYRKTT
ncbi:sulfate ABC transporter permease subunit CysW [Alkalinema pantanalense CENA528]|uniref:sulfate ABC transporter permease subunit CysW n=1 Tax=Alkalinema pantanalense TaxID=1620705 RepID=UPI003D6F282A